MILLRSRSNIADLISEEIAKLAFVLEDVILLSERMTEPPLDICIADLACEKKLYEGLED